MKPFAAIPVSFTQRIEILNIEHGIEDYVVFQWAYATRTDRKSRAKIRYNKSGEAYFNSYGKRYYMKDAQKIN